MWSQYVELKALLDSPGDGLRAEERGPGMTTITGISQVEMGSHPQGSWWRCLSCYDYTKLGAGGHCPLRTCCSA